MRRSTPTAAQREHRAQERKDQAAQLHADLEKKIAELANTEQWAAFLNYCTAFHAYSLNNVMLIAAQCPHASQVAGYRAWQALGRQVRTGERSLKIFGFSNKKVTETDSETGEETTRRYPRFPILSVFDISQTDPIQGATQPTDIAHRLHGDDATGIFEQVRDLMTGRGWTWG